MKKLSIYIHIPFCLRKCTYCNFISFCNKNDKKEDYVNAVCQEIKLRGKEIGKYYDVTSVYIGGGSPSTLKEGQVAKIMSELKNNFRLLQNCEISIETNPGSVTEKKLLEYKLVGVNRLSIGGQTLNEDILKILGRHHSVKDTKMAIKLAQKIGFENLNVDMMLALPTQKLSDVKKMAKFLVKKDIKHISPYSLILEPSTSLHKQVESGRVSLPSEDDSVAMYNWVYDFLTKKGYVRYEVSNFCQPDYESKHNLNYWQMGEYIAFGLAGHSYLNNTRFANTEDFDKYVDTIKEGKLPVVLKEKLTVGQRKDETLMLALRTSEGLNLKEFDAQFNCRLLVDKKKEIEFLTRHNFISVKKGYLRVNDNAFYVLNSIIAKLV